MGDYILKEYPQVGSEISSLIPAEIQDSYHFLDVVFTVRNIYFQAPRCITLNRYQLLLSELSRVHTSEILGYLDPFHKATKEEQYAALQYLDKDMYDHFNNLLVFCVGLTGHEVSALNLEPHPGVVRFTDKTVVIQTPHGYLSIIFRVYTPTGVSSERTREFYYRQLASCSHAISTRASLLLTDPMFPLILIPGVLDHKTLVSLAKDVIPVPSDI